MYIKNVKCFIFKQYKMFYNIFYKNIKIQNEIVLLDNYHYLS